MDIGKFKAITERQRGYLSFVNFLILLYLFFEKTPFRWWYLLVIPVGIFWTWFDTVYIMPKEYDYLHHKSPVFRELLMGKHDAKD